MYLGDRVVVDINDSVKVPCDDFGDFEELLKVKGPLRSDESVECDGGKVAHGHLIRRSVLHNLSAQVTALDGAQILKEY